MEQTEQFHRHDLVWLAHPAWDMLIQQQPALATQLRQWQQAEWPAVVRRRDGDAAEHEVCIGLALPPQQGRKIRVAARVPLQQISAHQPGLSLPTVMAVAGDSAQEYLQAMQRDAQQQGIRFRVYGSLAMQFLTGVPYMTPQSDIDLLFRPSDRQQLRLGLALLQRYRAWLPLDGEIIFPQEQAVAWKEWATADTLADAHANQRVLVKDSQTVRLVSRQELLDSLPLP